MNKVTAQELNDGINHAANLIHNRQTNGSADYIIVSKKVSTKLSELFVNEKRKESIKKIFND